LIAAKIDKLTDHIGRITSYLILPMVGLTFGIVVLRYGFGLGRVWLQELVIYLHATFFMLGVSYGLLKNTHVRVDVFKSFFEPKTQIWIEIAGAVAFIIPVTSLIFYKSLPYVYQSFIVFESSPDAGGLPGRFLLKALIPIFCGLVCLQACSIIIKNIKTLKNSNSNSKKTRLHTSIGQG
jgi:TRAP-type mannitol/chloroaromatic compound transport system permease small subunit